ncbi:MAG: AAA family ATPase [Candidatus Staskawiczbacteria bacterium]|nr:AAA family ATPase [Candidatus Staskawiczbacteria bacterium]
MKKIIGLTGEIGSGKDTFCGYVKENYKNVFVLRFSDALTDVLKIFFDSVKREDQQWLSPLLKQRFGEDILVRALTKKANSIGDGIIILNGVRAGAEAKAIRDAGGKIVYVTADQKTRWERVKTRGEKADDDVPFEKFLELEKAETEIQISKIGKQADYKLENNGSKEDFYKEIKKAIDLL